jgi:hypothetical protein
MDIVDMAMRVLTDGVQQSGAKLIALGTSAAAVALWNKIRAAVGAKGVHDTHNLATVEPGGQVDSVALRELLQQLAAKDTSTFSTIVHGDVHGDVIGRDKNVFHGD